MISVAMAVYNGEKYIEEQIRSILSRLGPNDEVIVSDDNPGNATEKIVRNLMKEDDRIVYVEGKRRGVVANFANAIRYTKGDYIFLSDRDDVWLPEKVKRCVEALKEGADLVVHNCYVCDKNLNITDHSFFASRGSKKGVLKNMVKNSYMGCCMAFRRTLLKYIFPIPANIPMHDRWIGLIAEIYGHVTFIDRPLIYYRVHENNVTAGRKKADIRRQLQWRNRIFRRIFLRIFFRK